MNWSNGKSNFVALLTVELRSLDRVLSQLFSEIENLGLKTMELLLERLVHENRGLTLDLIQSLSAEP